MIKIDKLLGIKKLPITGEVPVFSLDITGEFPVFSLESTGDKFYLSPQTGVLINFEKQKRFEENFMLIELLKGLVEIGDSSQGTSFCHVNLREEVRIANNIDTRDLENLGFTLYECEIYGDEWTFWGSLDSIGKAKKI